MNQTKNIQGFTTGKEAKEQLKLQLAQYLAQQSQSTQSVHRWMRRLEAAGMGIIVATFLVALYVSIAWKSINPIMIPIAWFVFAASVSPEMIFMGLDSIFLRAYPPVILPGNQPAKFITGNEAIWTGWALILGALLAAAFWGFFAYAVGTFNIALIVPLIRVLSGVLGVVITVAIVKKLIQDFSRSR